MSHTISLNQKSLNKLLVIIISILAFTALVACQEAQAVSLTVPAEETIEPNQILRLGEVSSDPATKFEEIELMVTYLEAELADAGIKKVEAVVTSELESMVYRLEVGDVDLFFDNSYPALIAYEESGAQPLLRRWRKGISEYHTNIVVRQDSGITDVQGLFGQAIAFDRPESSTGALVPRAYLLTQNYKLAEMNTPDSYIAADEIGYVFAGSDDNILAWVLEGKTAAGVIPSDDFDRLEDDIKSQLAVVAQTPDMPRHIVMARARLDPDLEGRIVEVLLHMHQTPEGQAALKSFGKTDQFDQLPLGPEGTMQALHELFEPIR